MIKFWSRRKKIFKSWFQNHQVAFCESKKNSPINHNPDLKPLTDIEKSTYETSKKLFDPKTRPMQLENTYQPHITSQLYQWQSRISRSKDWFVYSLPISVYGKLHLGHFYNCVIKDIINRYKLLKGFKINFSIGFDCYGLIIENIAVKEEFTQAKKLLNFTNDEIRLLCRNYIVKTLKEYVQIMKKWGLMTDFRSSYLTMSPLYEASVLECFGKLFEKMLIFRDACPVYWSINQKMPISRDDIEIDYEDRPGIFVKFKVIDYAREKTLEITCPNLYLLVYTTEPWTLTGIQGLSMNNMIIYKTFQDEKAHYIISSHNWEKYKDVFNKRGCVEIASCLGDALENFKIVDPLFGKILRIYMDNTIGIKIGSGINPIIPGHYFDDFALSLRNNLDRKGYINEEGYFLEELGDEYKGKNIRDDGSDFLIKKLTEKKALYSLQSSSSTIKYIHKKTQEKIIVLTIDKWFCKIPNKFRKELMLELNKVRLYGQPKEPKIYYPLKQYIENENNELCISSNHLWGIPLPIFYFKDTNKGQFLLDNVTLNHITNNVRKYGSEIWWKWDIVDLLPFKYKNLASKLIKGEEVFETWFESSCSWNALLINKIHEKKNLLQIDDENPRSIIEDERNLENQENFQKDEDNIYYPANLICEGHDQNKNLTYTSSILAGLLKDTVPFEKLKNHAILHKERVKINRFSGMIICYQSNLNNINCNYQESKISIEQLIEGAQTTIDQRKHAYGVDVLRLWVASTDENEKIKPEIISIESLDIDRNKVELAYLRKIYASMFGYIGNFKLNSHLTDDQFNPIDKLILSQLKFFLYNIEKAYNEFNLAKAYKLYIDFMKYYVLDIYLETIKNQITSNNEQRIISIKTTLTELVELTILAISPILCHNAEDIYQHISFKKIQSSIFYNQWPDITLDMLKKIREDIPILGVLVKLRNIIIEQLNYIRSKLAYYNNNNNSINQKYNIYIYLATDQIELRSILNKLNQDISDFFKANKVNIIYGSLENNLNDESNEILTFKDKISHLEKIFEFSIKIYKPLHYKCIKCMRYNNIIQDEICVQCKKSIPNHHHQNSLVKQNHLYLFYHIFL